MKSTFERLRTGLDEVEAFLDGEQKGFKIHVPDEIDVKSIRNKLKMTQSRFSNTFGFSLDAIKHWEGGRRTPEASARTLLTVIDKDPAAVLTALCSGTTRKFRVAAQAARSPSKLKKRKNNVARAARVGGSHRKHGLRGRN